MSSFGQGSTIGSGVGLSYAGDGTGFFFQPDPMGTTNMDSMSNMSNSMFGDSKSWSDISGGGRASSDIDSEFQASGISHIKGRGRGVGVSHGTGKTRSFGSHHAISHSFGKSYTEGEGKSYAEGIGRTVGVSLAPFLEPFFVAQLSSRSYYTIEEKLWHVIHQIMSLPDATAIIQNGRGEPVLFQVARVQEPKTTPAGLQLALYYAYEINKAGLTAEEVEKQLRKREARIHDTMKEYKAGELPGWTEKKAQKRRQNRSRVKARKLPTQPDETNPME